MLNNNLLFFNLLLCVLFLLFQTRFKGKTYKLGCSLWKMLSLSNNSNKMLQLTIIYGNLMANAPGCRLEKIKGEVLFEKNKN